MPLVFVFRDPLRHASLTSRPVRKEEGDDEDDDEEEDDDDEVTQR
jgi:hypothetical protein